MDVLFYSAESTFGPHIEDYAMDNGWEPWGPEVHLLKSLLYLIWYKREITGLYHADRLFGLAVMGTKLLLADSQTQLSPTEVINQTADWLARRYKEWTWLGKRPVRKYKEQLDSMEHMFREHMKQLTDSYKANQEKIPKV